jgi:anti-sigma factor RsiW
MINQETKYKLQACLDNELGAAESRKTAAWLEQDAEARALFAELSEVKSLLAGNELEISVPEPREFYWSKIERALRSEPGRRGGSLARLRGYPWWVRLLAPAVGVGILLIAGVSLVKLPTTPTTVSYLHEIETPLKNTSTISFYSQSAGMTVVWVENQGQ